jgi:transcriptional regulator with XRE-family HTH domain
MPKRWNNYTETLSLDENGENMKIYDSQSNKAILDEVGLRIKQRRISLSITQQELSEKTGISIRTINNIESGNNFSFDNFVLILKTLKLADNLNELIPDSKIDPIALLNFDKPRKRASKIKKSENWKWGDE